MSQKKARAARQHAPPTRTVRPAKNSFLTTWKGVAVGAAVVAVIAATFVVPKLTGGDGSQTRVGAAGHSMSGMTSAAKGDGPPLGAAPRFDERNVETGQTISSDTLRGQKTLLFFSEGIMCQACLQQIKDIDAVSQHMASRHIKLVSVTPDTPDELKQAIAQYGITSPVISDGDRTMSEAFNTLGKGMHADTPGHAFVLIDGDGKVVWQRDYYQPPSRTMYVDPGELFKDIPRA